MIRSDAASAPFLFTEALARTQMDTIKIMHFLRSAPLLSLKFAGSAASIVIGQVSNFQYKGNDMMDGTQWNRFFRRRGLAGLFTAVLLP